MEAELVRKEIGLNLKSCPCFALYLRVHLEAYRDLQPDIPWRGALGKPMKVT